MLYIFNHKLHLTYILIEICYTCLQALLLHFPFFFYFYLLSVFCFAEWNNLSTFCSEANENHLCEVILNFDQQFREKCHVKLFLYLVLVAILFG